MLYCAVVQGTHTYGGEIWPPLAQPTEADHSFVQFGQQLCYLHRKAGKHNVFLLGNTLPFSTRKHAVLFLLRRVAAPYDSLLHQCVVLLYRWHFAGHCNWLTVVMGWVQRCDARFTLRTVDGSGGWQGLCSGPTTWNEFAPQQRWRFPGLWPGRDHQVWTTKEYASEGEWRMAWLELIGWARRVVSRYAAAEKKDYFLRVQLRRVSEGGD